MVLVSCIINKLKTVLEEDCCWRCRDLNLNVNEEEVLDRQLKRMVAWISVKIGGQEEGSYRHRVSSILSSSIWGKYDQRPCQAKSKASLRDVYLWPHFSTPSSSSLFSLLPGICEAASQLVLVPSQSVSSIVVVCSCPRQNEALFMEYINMVRHGVTDLEVCAMKPDMIYLVPGPTWFKYTCLHDSLVGVTWLG